MVVGKALHILWEQMKSLRRSAEMSGTILANRIGVNRTAWMRYVTICRARRIEAGAAADRCCRSLGCRLQRADGAAPTASAAASPAAATATATTAADGRDHHGADNGGVH